MGYGADDTTGVSIGEVRGALRSQSSPQGAPDAYEYGTIGAVSRAGRYKVFQNAFAARPIVVVTPLRSTSGTFVPKFIGTPNVGSFQVAAFTAPAGGSATLNFVAFGAR